MGGDGWFTIAVVITMVAVMATNRVQLDWALLTGLGVLVVTGMVDLDRAFSGFANQSVIMIGCLFVVAGGLKETGALEAFSQRLLGRPSSLFKAQLRLLGPVALMSAFMNNTPVVAMYLPIIKDWARKLGVSPSRLFMPLSFSAILGGQLTLIGTASNIILLSLYVERFGSLAGGMPFWGVGLLGLPCLIAGLAFIVVFSRFLLPERIPVREDVEQARQYLVEMVVEANSPIIGKSIEEAGLRHLPGLFLTQIERGNEVLVAVEPLEKIHAGDRLAFVGILDSVVDLGRIRGLVPATNQVEKVNAEPCDRAFVEAVVSHISPLVGKTVRASRFRTMFNAAIIAVHRGGQHIEKKIGDIVLRAGDTLLLETHVGFVSVHRNTNSFYLVSRVEGISRILHEKSRLALFILLGMAVMLAFFQFGVKAAVAAALLMVLTRCLSASLARRAIDWQILLVIGAALGIGEALEQTKAIAWLAIQYGAGAEWLGLGVGGQLFALVMITMVAAQFVTNYGAAVLMFPLAMEAASKLDSSPLPFLFALMVGAGCSFLTPIGYQTNVMVYGPGGYRFFDFARLGLPLALLVAFVVSIMGPIVYG